MKKKVPKKKKSSVKKKYISSDNCQSISKTERYREEYPGANDVDIELIRWALHDEED